MSDFSRSLLGRSAALGDRDLLGRDYMRPDALLEARLSRDSTRRSTGSTGFAEPSLRGMNPLGFQALVIVVDPERRCRDYAEMFLGKLKKSGLVCDITIIDKFTSPSQVIDDATGRGMLYTASVTMQNEIHGSVTINILQGQPQEHRNMPYEDALKLVARNFDAHLLKLGGGDKDDSSPTAVPVLPTKDEPEEEIDPALSLLLINLAEGKNLRLQELDKVIAFLKKKRARLVPVAPAQPIPTTYQQQEKRNKALSSPEAPKPVQPPNLVGNISSSQAEDLQAKINQLFGNTSKQQSTVGVNHPKSSSGGNNYANVNDMKKKSVGIDFNNPTVQSALQNLMKTGPNLLDSLRSTSDLTATTQHPALYETAGSRTSPEHSLDDRYRKQESSDRSDSSRPAKRAKPGRHAIAGFY